MFWTCLLLFALGHAAAVAWFRSGRPWIGVLVVAVLWLLGDAAVVLRFLFEPPLALWATCAQALMAFAGLVVAHVGFLLLRRRRVPVQADRVTRYRQGLIAYMKGDLTAAGRSFRALCRRDPWDQDAWAGVHMVQAALPALRPRAVPAARRAEAGRTAPATRKSS